MQRLCKIGNGTFDRPSANRPPCIYATAATCRTSMRQLQWTHDMYHCMMPHAALTVCMTGAGLARPVVSIMIASKRWRRRSSLLRMRMRSPRTVQHTQPLFICASTAHSAHTRCEFCSTATARGMLQAMLCREVCRAAQSQHEHSQQQKRTLVTSKHTLGASLAHLKDLLLETMQVTWSMTACQWSAAKY